MRVVLPVLLCVALSAGAAAAAEIVGPKELKAAWLDGRSVTTVGPRGGKSEITFRNDGTLVRTGGRSAAGDGKRAVDTARNAVCQQFVPRGWRLAPP